LWEPREVGEYACPECGDEFGSVWYVAVGDSGGYKPVFGGPVALDVGRCDKCNTTYERSDGDPWCKQGGK
jgi:hypothetical protein